MDYINITINVAIVLKENSTLRISLVQIKDDTFTKIFAEFFSPNQFSKGETVRQSLQFLSNLDAIMFFPVQAQIGAADVL